MDDLALPQLFGLAAALGGGLLVGVQRERDKDESAPGEPAGVRTFSIVALLGAVAGLLGPAVTVLAGAGVIGFALVAYVRRAAVDPGLTSEFALLASFAFGLLALDHPRVAAALYVLLAVLLQSKHALHHFTRRVLSRREVDDALLLAASALIVLPLLPDRTLDPYDVLNPRRIWLFAVLVMAINAAGYVALRAFGARRGLVLAGLFGGFVSSSATIAGMGQRARADAALRPACIAGALLSNVATVAELGAILVVAGPGLFGRLALPLAAAGTVAVLMASAWLRRNGGAATPADAPSGRPFALGQALLFAGIVAVALFAAAALRTWLGGSGVVAAAAATGFADVHAAAVSLAQLGDTSPLAAWALAAAYTTNSAVKCIAAGAGGRAFALPIVAGVVLMNLALVGVLVLGGAPGG